MGADTGELWSSLAKEIERLTAGRTRGKSFSEDFAVDRVCSAIAKLRQQHERREAEERSAEELKNLRAELAMEDQRLRMQQSKIDDVRVQIKQAQGVKEELRQELESEEAGRREASDGQAKQWKEAAYRTHICLSSLRFKEQELAQLQNAATSPQGLGQVWDRLVKKLQSELDVANVEALEAKREADKLAAECSKAERELSAVDPSAVAATDAARPFRGPCLTLPAPKPEEREAVREELFRIASRADDMAAAQANAVRGSRPAALSNHSSPRPASTVAAEPRDALPQRPGNSILDEAQRVLEKMDRLHAWRNPSSVPGNAVLYH